jgi:hypothetical protein
MYRYVFKRVKETFEIGINARKSYACQQANSLKNQNESQANQQQHHHQSRQIANLQEINFLSHNDHQQKRYEDFKRKYNCKHPNNCNPFLQAITWVSAQVKFSSNGLEQIFDTSPFPPLFCSLTLFFFFLYLFFFHNAQSTALVAGFYTAQLLCLYRRNQRLDPKKCFYARYIDHKNRFLQRRLFCAAQSKQKHHHQQQRSLVPSSKFKCPLQKLLARRKSSSSSSQVPSSSSSQSRNVVIEDDDVFGWGRDFATFTRFDKFYDNFGDNSTYKRVYFNVNNLNNDSCETLVKSKDSGQSSGSSSSSSQSDDDKIDALLSNLSVMVGEMEFQLGIHSLLHGHHDEAAEHFRMAASSNHASSLFNLALLYEQGLGVKQDKTIAYKLYQSAGELGHDKALFNQGIFHAKGLGGARKSFRLAKRFFKKSAALGNSDAIEALSMLLPDYQKSLSHEPEDYIVADHSSKNSSLILENAEFRGNFRSIAVS